MLHDTPQNKDNLVMIWTTADPETAQFMVFMYARNAILRGWWQRVRLLVWGASTRALSTNPILQEALPALQEAGVEITVCKACADSCNVTSALEALGLDVRYVGEELTQMLKSDWVCLTI